MKTNSPGPYAAVAEQYPRTELEPGDRFLLRDKLVEIVARTSSGYVDRYGNPTDDLRVRSVATGRVLAKAVPNQGRARGVQLLADRPRPDMLTLNFFPGGSAALGQRSPLEVPLTLGGNVSLGPTFVGAGVQMTATGEVTDRPTFYKMSAVVDPTQTEGDLAILGRRSYSLWGSRQWDLLGTRLRSIGLLDGGLDAAGVALLEIADNVRILEPEDAWFAALSAATGLPLPAPEHLPVLSMMAAKWQGTAAELLATVGAAVAA